VLTLVTPGAGTVVGSPATLSGTVMSSPGREVVSATIMVGSQSTPLTLTPGMWSVSITLPQSVEGSQSFTISALDASGQTTTVTVALEVDTLGPRTTLTRPDAGVVVGSTAVLGGAVTDRSSISMVTITSDAGVASATLDQDGGWTSSATFPANLDRVTFPLVIGARDQLGNTSSSPAQVLVDTLGPVLSLISPANGVVVGATPTLSGAAVDSSGPVSQFSVDVGGGPIPSTVSATSWAQGVTFPAGLNRVQRTVTLRGRDPLGNTSAVPVQVLVDTQGPALTLTTPGSGVAVGATAMLSGTALDASGAVSQFTVDVGAGPVAVSVAGNNAWTTTVTFPAGLDRVLRNVTLRGQDPLGNVTTTVVQVLVDTAPPRWNVAWAGPTARTTNVGGSDFRDPQEVASGVNLFRRHETVNVAIQAGVPDVNPASVSVSVGGVSTPAQSGSNCSTDGGFCRLVPIRLDGPPLPSLRANFAVTATGADLLGNSSFADAGVVGVSRWVFSFDGGSATAGFALTPSGKLVVPHPQNNHIVLLREDGARQATWSLSSSAPFVAVGQVPLSSGSRSRLVYALARPGGGSEGIAFSYDVPATPGLIWAGFAMRTGLNQGGPVLRVDPANGAEEVALVYQDSTSLKPAAFWYQSVGPSEGQSQVRVPTGTATIAGSVSSVVATAGALTATDGNRLFGFSGNGNSFRFLEERSIGIQSPGTFTTINSIAGLLTPPANVVGVGNTTGGGRTFFQASFPTSFNQALANAPNDALFGILASGSTVYFVATSQTNFVGRLCRGSISSTSLTCTSDPTESISNAAALGEGDTIYAIASRPPSTQALLQVRTASTLALRWEAPLGVSMPCLNLTPTCINGVPMVGCIDLTGRVVFVATDARGIDVNADWPMLGHDPGTTWNASTPLDSFACP
jgi:hypothetical protein